MPKYLDFFFDLMSPYSYLASTQVPSLAARTGATVRYRPIFLPGLMKEVGNRGPTAVPNKALYTLKDLNDWAQHYGLPPIYLPDPFPFIAASANRCVLVAGEHGKIEAFTAAMYRRIWAEQRDCNDDTVLASAFAEVGLSADECLARSRTDELKARLRANTDEAIEAGFYGVPTFLVNGEMFVGNDRLMFVEKALLRAPST